MYKMIANRLILASLLLAIWSCSVSENEMPADVSAAPIILISMDGFRWDYMDRTDTPNMDYLAAEGVEAEAMIPVFPSYTFPNHLSIVTGRYPENHGIMDAKNQIQTFLCFSILIASFLKIMSRC